MRLFARLCAFLSVAFVLFHFQNASAQEKISGPYTHDNLSIYLIHGPDKLPGKNFMTLGEALKTGKVIVHETGNVNQLAIENLSKNDIYIQSGDIVKGGKQDRVISLDFILKPDSGKVPIDAFCVEQSRWHPRGNEEAGRFNDSSHQLASKELKLAAKKSRNQGEVWGQVAATQEKLKNNLKADVRSEVSATSLELSLSNSKLNATADAYTKTLAALVQQNPDAIGYVFAINGKLNSADVYLSHNLFAKLWPKLLKSNAVEAISELNAPKSPGLPKVAEVQTFLAQAQAAPAQTQAIAKGLDMKTAEDDKRVYFETFDKEQNTWVHRNYMMK